MGAPFLQSLAARSVTADYMLPSFPSVTFPNHFAIVTGLYPSHNGVVANTFWDRRTKRVCNVVRERNDDWYQGAEPFWNVAERNGILTACMFWVGSEAVIAGMRPTYHYKYSRAFSHKQKVDKVLAWLRLPQVVRPHFITLYFPEPDHSGHVYGTEAWQTRQAVLAIDSALALLDEGVKKLGLQNVNFIFVSDHGMINVDNEHLIAPPRLDTSRFVCVNAGTFAGIYAKADTAGVWALYDSLRKNQKEYAVVLSSQMPPYLHYAKTDDRQGRIGDILLLPSAPRVIGGTYVSVGKHGFDPYQTPQMRTVFYGWGPAFASPKRVAPFENVDIFALLADVFALSIPFPIDGKHTLATQVLRKHFRGGAVRNP